MLDSIAPRKSSKNGVQEERLLTADCRQQGFETATSSKCGFMEKESRDSFENDAGFQQEWCDF